MGDELYNQYSLMIELLYEYIVVVRGDPLMVEFFDMKSTKLLELKINVFQECIRERIYVKEHPIGYKILEKFPK